MTKTFQVLIFFLTKNIVECEDYEANDENVTIAKIILSYSPHKRSVYLNRYFKAYDHFGRRTNRRQIARQVLNDHNSQPWKINIALF